MAGTRIIFPEFRDEQGDSRYPFADQASLLSSTGQVIPKDAFLDASLYVINAPAPLYISEIEVGSDVTIRIGSATSSFAAYAKYNPFVYPANPTLAVYDAYERPAGVLLLNADSAASIAGWGAGSHLFTATDTEFVSSVVVPAQEPGVRAVTATGVNDFITGDVWLVGRRGVVLRKTDARTVRIDVVGAPLFKREICGADGNPNTTFTPKTFLRTINGCAPDEFGNFTITAVPKTAADSTLRIYPEEAAIKIAVVGKKVIQ